MSHLSWRALQGLRGALSAQEQPWYRMLRGVSQLQFGDCFRSMALAKTSPMIPQATICNKSALLVEE